MKYYLLFFLILATQWVYGQNRISGRTLDEEKSPLPQATILISKESNLITGGVTDNDGRFDIKNIPSGSYQLSVSFMGFESYKRNVIVGDINRVLDIGNIILIPSSLAIDDVVVTAQRSSSDNKNYSLSDIVTDAGGSVLNAMKNLPGVTVDQENKVLLRGSDKVLILIDGKESALTGFGSQKGLENLSTSQIESIEVINNPSAKYDASGMAGVINIKLKEYQEMGINGDVGFAYGIGQLTKRKDDLPTGMSSYYNNSKYTPSLNLNYRKNKVNLFVQSFICFQDYQPNNEFSTRYYPNGDFVENQVAENRSKNHYNVKMGLDIDINDRNSITLFGLYDYEWHTDTTRVWYLKNNDYNNPVRKWSFNESEGTGFTNVTMQHRYKFAQAGHELNSQYHFTKGWEDETYELYQDATDEFPKIDGDLTHVIAPEYVHQLSSDYVKPLSFGRFEAGIQARSRYMPIEYTMDRATENSALLFDFGDWSKWRENLGAVYLNLFALTKHVNIEMGLRGEYVDVSYKFAPNKYFSDDKYSYFKLFPNIRLSHKLNTNRQLSLYYSKRTDRPSEGILRIFPKYDDPELLKVGNPQLRPQYVDIVDLTYKRFWNSGSYYLSVYYKNIDDYFTRIYIQDPLHPNITIKGYSNIPRAENMGLEFNLNQQITNAWKMNINGNIYRNKIYAYTGTIDFPEPTEFVIDEQIDNPWYIKMNNSFQISNSMQLQVIGTYFSEKSIPQGKELSRWGVDCGFKSDILKDKLELNISMNDIFNTMAIRQKIDQGNGYHTDYENYYETQVFSVGVRYKF